ncbi:MAG: hypothetical protein ACE5HY_04545, partial [Candidatus Hydrothermarchaeales archaeon]
MPGFSIEKALLVLFVCILVVSPAAALEVTDTVKITSNSGSRDPAWSPDGHRIAYTSGAYDIWTMQADGKGKRQLTNDIYRDEDPVWSPDGSRILYVSEHDGNQQIWIMNADGTEKRQVTFTKDWKSAPVWSPDGSRIAYVSGRYPEYDIWTMKPDGTGLNRLTFEEKEDWAPAWSPDGSRIAYISRQSGNFDLWLMDADGTNKRRVVEGVYWREPQISWSPDGSRIAYVSGQYPDYDIWITDLDGTNRERLTFYSYTQLAPAWSPDGSKMAYTSDESGSYEIWVVEVQILIALPPADINPAPTPYLATAPDPETSQLDPMANPVISPSEVPQIFEDELISKDDSTTQQTDKETTRNKDLSKDSFEEKEELGIPRPDEDDEGIVVPTSFGEGDEIEIPEAGEGLDEGLIMESSPSRDWLDERFLIALLLAIPFAVLV